MLGACAQGDGAGNFTSNLTFCSGDGSPGPAVMRDAEQVYGDSLLTHKSHHAGRHETSPQCWIKLLQRLRRWASIKVA